MRYPKALSLAILLLSAPAWAQRAQSAAYDSDRKVKFSGIVTRIDWVNPGAFFFVNVKDASGTIANWAVEFGNPLDLEKDGWKSTSLHIGDAVSVEGSPARGPARQALATSVILTKTGAKIFVPSNKPLPKIARQSCGFWPVMMRAWSLSGWFAPGGPALDLPFPPPFSALSWACARKRSAPRSVTRKKSVRVRRVAAMAAMICRTIGGVKG